VRDDQTTTITFIPPEAPSEPSTGEVAVAVEEVPEGFGMLVVKRGPNAGSRFVLEHDLTRVGRHPESDIFLDDVTVSRRHADIQRREDKFYVQDKGSLNGTYVNRQRVDETPLASGDEQQIGKFKLVFFEGE